MGANSDEAYKNLLKECAYLKKTTFKEIFGYKLDKDYQQTRKDYNLST